MVTFDAGEVAALYSALCCVEAVARELDGMFVYHPWTTHEPWGLTRLDRRGITEATKNTLLSLHDYLNDVSALRSGDPELRSAARETYERRRRAQRSPCGGDVDEASPTRGQARPSSRGVPAEPRRPGSS